MAIIAAIDADAFEHGSAVTATTNPLTGGSVFSIDGKLSPVNGLRTEPVRVGTFGDSTASVGNAQSPANQDVSKCVISAWQSGMKNVALAVDKCAVDFLYPQAFVVVDGGIPGSSTAGMVARDTSPYSITRRATMDVINAGVDVVLYRGGSINDLLGVTSANVDSIVAATYANHCAIIRRFLSAGVKVIDSGIYGFTNGANTATDQTYTRLALTRLNKMFSDFAAQYPTLVAFVSPVGVVSDSSGAYLSFATLDGTHLSGSGQLAMTKLEAAALAFLFGQSSGSRYRGQNAIANAAFAKTSSSGIGVSADGLALYYGNCTASGAQIEEIEGQLFQTAIYTSSASSCSSQTILPFDPSATGSGLVAPLNIALGDVYGFEVDFYFSPISSAQLAASFNLRLDIKDNIGSGEIIVDKGTYNKCSYGTVKGKIAFPPLVFGDVQANLLASTQWSMSVDVDGVNAVYKFGVSNPRIVKLN